MCVQYILRKAFDCAPDGKVSHIRHRSKATAANDTRSALKPYLPRSILWRQKEQFSDGVGYSWIDGYASAPLPSLPLD